MLSITDSGSCAASFYISGVKPGWKWYKVAFIVFFIIWPNFCVVWLNRRLFVRAAIRFVYRTEAPQSQAEAVTWIDELMGHVLGDVKEKVTLENSIRLNRVSRIDLYALYPTSHGIIDVPFGYILGGFKSYRSPELDSGYYWSSNNVFSPSQVNTKIEELQMHPDRDLLLPDWFVGACPSDPIGSRSLIRVLFLYPYERRVVHSRSIMQPLCSYIVDHYQLVDPPTDKAFDYGLWARKPER